MAELANLGRYQLRRVLGKGAMGVVYEGFDPTLGRRVAVKTILKAEVLDAETELAYSARFIQEAKAVARLNHPNIVQVYDFGVEGEVAYLVMEFIEGRELRSFFDAKEKFDTAETVRVMGELLDALEFAHEAGVIHRDVKPANVMLDAQHRAKLADFGVARIQDSAQRTQANTMGGTPAFMSPEQISGKKVDRRTDIFSAGNILYQLLTGEQPFKGEGAWTVIKAIMQDDPPRPSSLVQSVSPVFDEIVNKALAKKPEQRFANAREFAAALRGALQTGQQHPTSAAPAQKAKLAVHASETELEFWRAIQNSNEIAELELYVEQFPDGAYSKLARLKVAKLREPLEAARREAEEKARLEAEEKAKRDAEERARKEAEERAERAALDQARREAAEKAKRDAEAKARRDAEEKVRQAQALARLKQQQEVAARAKAAIDEDATVAISKAAPPAEHRKSLALPAIIAAVVIAGAIGAYLLYGRTPAPVSAPVAVSPPVQKVEIPASAPAKPEVAPADIEKIRKESEERIRREYADKSAAEQAAAAKAATETAVQEKLIAAKAAAAEKTAVEKAAAEKAAAEKTLTAKAAAEKAATEKAAAERVAAEKAAAEKAAAEKAVAEKAAAEMEAAQKSAAAKAAAAAKPGWPSVGDRWVYEARDADWPEKKYEVVVEVQAVTSSSVRDVFRPARGAPVVLTHQAGAHLIGVAPGIASFSPYLRAFQELRAGERWASIDYKQLWNCDTFFTCDASARVVGMERVSVRAGTYDAWKIVVELQIGGYQRGGTGALIYWFAEGPKRVVKYQSRVNVQISIGLTWTQPNMDMELVSYVPVAAGK